jgi:hypothetical protein
MNVQTFTLAKSIPDLESIAFNGITVDANGNSYVTVRFQGTAIFDEIQLTSYGNNTGYYDIFIAKYNRDLNCLWAKHAGSGNNTHHIPITQYNNGNLLFNSLT